MEVHFDQKQELTLDLLWRRIRTANFAFLLIPDAKRDLFVDQWLLSSCVLYLPDNILHWTVAIDMFAGDEPAVDHIGCGLDKDMNSGRKYVSDESSDASLRSLISQK